MFLDPRKFVKRAKVLPFALSLVKTDFNLYPENHLVQLYLYISNDYHQRLRRYLTSWKYRKASM